MAVLSVKVLFFRRERVFLQSASITLQLIVPISFCKFKDYLRLQKNVLSFLKAIPHYRNDGV